MSLPCRRLGPCRRRRRGLALIEALVTLVVLSLAALGYAALQLRGLGTQAGATWMSKATVLAADAADRVRANPAGLAAGAYDALLVPPAVSPGCTLASPCSGGQVAQRDFFRWRSDLAAMLPQGQGVICRDATPDDGSDVASACDGSGTRLAIKVFWRERGVASRLVMVVQP
ncbi:MAG: type IV pilus modification protein PilV [Sphaerotilus natans]